MNVQELLHALEGDVLDAEHAHKTFKNSSTSIRLVEAYKYYNEVVAMITDKKDVLEEEEDEQPPSNFDKIMSLPDNELLDCVINSTGISKKDLSKILKVPVKTINSWNKEDAKDFSLLMSLCFVVGTILDLNIDVATEDFVCFLLSKPIESMKELTFAEYMKENHPIDKWNTQLAAKAINNFFRETAPKELDVL